MSITDSLSKTVETSCPHQIHVISFSDSNSSFFVYSSKTPSTILQYRIEYLKNNIIDCYQPITIRPSGINDYNILLHLFV